MDQLIKQVFTVKYEYDVRFTTDLFSPTNHVLSHFFASKAAAVTPKVLVVVDAGVAACHERLAERITACLAGIPNLSPVTDIMMVPGGEAAKNDPATVDRIIDAVDQYRIDRHSYIMAVGGGALLDAVGYAAAIAHRGIRHIRVPTTVLSQNDSGMGVKNGVNYGGKKNFIGTFSPPVAVFNDDMFLTTLSHRDWLAGISEAIKVALIKDATFFEWIASHAVQLHNRDREVMNQLIYRCAELHLRHIAGADPFEFGSSRPLDFGHWSAHKLEQLSDFEVRHGEAVAIGIALDSVYSSLVGLLPQAASQRIIDTLQAVGLPVFHPLLEGDNTHHPLLAGLEEFREHLGGRLTVMLLEAIGSGVEVHALTDTLILQAATTLQHQVSPSQLI